MASYRDTYIRGISVFWLSFRSPRTSKNRLPRLVLEKSTISADEAYSRIACCYRIITRAKLSMSCGGYVPICRYIYAVGME